MKILKRIKGHHIAKVIFTVCVFMIMAYALLMAKYIGIITPYPIVEDSTYTMVWLNHYLSTFVVNNGEPTILITLFFSVSLMVWIMDITVGVGRSRSQEKIDRIEKEKNDKYKKEMAELRNKIHMVKIFYDEVSIGDKLETVEFGIQEVIDIDVPDHSVIIENGLNFYPDDNDMFNYVVS